MTVTVGLASRYSFELDIPPRLIRLIQVGDVVDWIEHSDETENYTIELKLFSGANMLPGDAATTNAEFVIIVEDVAPKADPSSITRALVRLYVTPAAKLEDVRAAHRQLFRDQ